MNKEKENIEKMSIDDFLEEVESNIRTTESRLLKIKNQYNALYNLYNEANLKSKTHNISCYYNHTTNNLYYVVGDKKIIGFKQFRGKNNVK